MSAYPHKEREQCKFGKPDSHKFDAQRVLCGLCDLWIMFPDEQDKAIAKWLEHRAICNAGNPPYA